jgi:hypothetical protein
VVAARVILIAALALALHGGADARGAVAVGIQGWSLPTERSLEAVADGGMRDFRVVFDWSVIGARRNANDWTAYDAVMASAARARVRVLPVLLGCPAHLCRARLHAPTTAAQRRGWSAFAGALARRYGRGGTFWADNPQLDERPFVAYQIWNEPNVRGYWNGRPDPAAYVRFVARSRTALRRADPRATVVLAGLAESVRGMTVANFLSGVYAVAGSRSKFDAVAIHVYARTSARAASGVQAIRQILNARGDRGTPIWVTEAGWATGGPSGPFRATRARQAELIRALVRRLRARASADRIGALYLFSLQDRRTRAGESDWFGPHTGLFDLQGRPKPAWKALAADLGGSGHARLEPVPRAPAD